MNAGFVNNNRCSNCENYWRFIICEIGKPSSTVVCTHFFCLINLFCQRLFIERLCKLISAQNKHIVWETNTSFHDWNWKSSEGTRIKNCVLLFPRTDSTIWLLNKQIKRKRESLSMRKSESGRGREREKRTRLFTFITPVLNVVTI